MSIQVIVLWMEVQRTWSYLESIFIGSEDIRKQLPEDSDRYSYMAAPKIDVGFKHYNLVTYLGKSSKKKTDILRSG